MTNESKSEEQNISVNEFINSLVEEAATSGASDIHVEPLLNSVRVRFRIDGVLQELYTLPFDNMDYIINRLKVLANLEIGNIPVPEDGHFSIDIPSPEEKKRRTVDVRVSLFPTVTGEAAVLRILNRSEMLLSVQDLGMEPELLAKVKELNLYSYGMFLVTGPTGSGKTTTLYSLLMGINRDQQNVITLEDPVEFHFDDIRQSQIRPETGFTFAKGMKSILRQDPDVIMIGEIRDEETAEHAVQAALSGRLVYSSVHANTTVGAIARLIDMGIERGLIAYSINGIISQRLVRKICTSCIIPDSPRPEYIAHFSLQKETIEYKKGKGCDACNNTGYKGRIGIFELFPFDDNVRALIVDKSPLNVIQQYAEQAGMKTLRQDAIEKVRSGIVSLEDIAKAV